jgi:Na+/H+ antiporter NhaD/arsenite permease-like protein
MLSTSSSWASASGDFREHIQPRDEDGRAEHDRNTNAREPLPAGPAASALLDSRRPPRRLARIETVSHAAGSGALPWWSALPFVALLLSIALAPLLAVHWWERNVNRARLTAVIALPFAAWWLSTRGSEGVERLTASLEEYLSFIVLLGSLFVISGGIHVAGSLSGTPWVNTALLAIGAVLANLIGTTGASMVLIHPLLRANARRAHGSHLVIFFMFVVSNTAGLLTPLGDPPLYLGFIHGVPFEWTLHLLPQWLVVNGMLLLIFHLVDRRDFARETREPGAPPVADPQAHGPLRVEGLLNAVFLLGVALVALAHGRGWGSADGHWPFGLAEAAIALLALTAWHATRPEYRQANRFAFAPIIEVAVLFAGIFVTMTAPLLLLNVHGHRLGLTEPWHYFWATGLVSSVLDNAPTYLSFAASLAGQLGVSVGGKGYLAAVIDTGRGEQLLAAISCGAVFMGALTYIGNGPNFMVKTLAEAAGVRMPSFFGYMRWSLLILLPLFAAVSLLFFA